MKIFVISSGILLFFIILVFYLKYNHERNKKFMKLLHENENENETKSELTIEKILDIVTTHFLVQPCTRCYEDNMELETISPKGRSISYICTHCNKKLRATASSKRAEKLTTYWEEFSNLVNEKFRIIDLLQKTHSEPFQNISPKVFKLAFTTTEPIMPYEKTTREHIPEAVRGVIWRRDNGKCVVCNSKQNLQYDHIIPVSKGRATTVTNLQLLCRYCNQKKEQKCNSGSCRGTYYLLHVC